MSTLVINEPQDMQTGLPTKVQWPAPIPPATFPWDDEERQKRKEQNLHIPDVNPLESQWPDGWDEDNQKEDETIEHGPKLKSDRPIPKGGKPPVHFFGAQGNNNNQQETNMFALNQFSDPVVTNQDNFDPSDILESPTLNWNDDDSDSKPDIFHNEPEDGGLGTPTINWAKDSKSSGKAKSQSDEDLLIVPGLLD